MYITFEIFLANFSFLTLLISMLIYWIQASNFDSPNILVHALHTEDVGPFGNDQKIIFKGPASEKQAPRWSDFGPFLFLQWDKPSSRVIPLQKRKVIEALPFPPPLTPPLPFLKGAKSSPARMHPASWMQGNLSGGKATGWSPPVFAIEAGGKMQELSNIFGSVGMLISNLCLFMLLALRWYESGHFPLSNLYESLMFLSWSLTLIHLFVLRNKKEILKTVGLFPFNFKGLRINNLEPTVVRQQGFLKNQLINKLIGSITAPCALFTNAFATFSLPKEMQESSPLVPALQSNWLMMHVTVMILSYAALILGSLLSIGFLVIANTFDFEKYSFEGKALLAGFPYPPAGGEEACDTAPASPFVASQLPPKDLRRGFYWMGELEATKNKDFPCASMGKIGAEPHSPAGGGGRGVGKAFPGDTGHAKHTRMQVQKNRQAANLAKILDNLSYRILGLGFPLLTIGILSGAVWANEAWGSYWSWDPKETWALLTWLVFAIYLHTRLTKGWEGKKPALIASLGFVTVWICFLGVNLIGEGLHSYGWLS
jgi:cytochrome c-type biogenesis protein CcsB